MSRELLQHVDRCRLVGAFDVVEDIAVRIQERTGKVTDPHHLLAAEADGWWRLERSMAMFTVSAMKSNRMSLPLTPSTRKA